MFAIGVVTERNRQPEPPKRKPSEDSYAFGVTGEMICAAVMDGIPVLRDADGKYPEENGSIAAILAAETIPAYCNHLFCLPNADVLREGFWLANEKIRDDNSFFGAYKRKEQNWPATVGCALWADESSGKAVFGYIGDPLAFRIGKDGSVELLTEDQLRHFEDHIYAEHRDMFQDPGTTAFVREHQDKNVRNVWDARCWCGRPLRGWGALTGEDEAMRFVVTAEMDISPGTRIILASDAIEAIGAGNAKERKASDYRETFLALTNLTVQETAEELLSLIRKNEKEKNYKSDDATILVVDFK